MTPGCGDRGGSWRRGSLSGSSATLRVLRISDTAASSVLIAATERLDGDGLIHGADREHNIGANSLV